MTASAGGVESVSLPSAGSISHRDVVEIAILTGQLVEAAKVCSHASKQHLQSTDNIATRRFRSAFLDFRVQQLLMASSMAIWKAPSVMLYLGLRQLLQGICKFR